MAFQVKFYKNTAERIRVDKSAYLKAPTTRTGTLRDESSITHPVILVESPTLITHNYCYISAFDSRYYFINDIKVVSNKLYEISLEVDVLMSWKNGLLNTEAFIDRNENNYDNMIIDNKLPIKVGQDIDVDFVPNELFDSTSGQYVLQGLRVSVGNKYPDSVSYNPKHNIVILYTGTEDVDYTILTSDTTAELVDYMTEDPTFRDVYGKTIAVKVTPKTGKTITGVTYTTNDTGQINYGTTIKTGDSYICKFDIANSNAIVTFTPLTESVNVSLYIYDSIPAYVSRSISANSIMTTTGRTYKVTRGSRIRVRYTMPTGNTAYVFKDANVLLTGSQIQYTTKITDYTLDIYFEMTADTNATITITAASISGTKVYGTYRFNDILTFPSGTSYTQGFAMDFTCGGVEYTALKLYADNNTGKQRYRMIYGNDTLELQAYIDFGSDYGFADETDKTIRFNTEQDLSADAYSFFTNNARRISE